MIAESSSPSTSSSGSLFHSAALPKGLERLRRVHQKYPGKIASLSLLRMRELVAMTLGRGTAEESENPLPAVATPYLIQVLLSRYPAGGGRGSDENNEGAEDSGGCDRSGGEQRSSQSARRLGAEIQGVRAGSRAAELGSGKSAGVDSQRPDVSGLQTGGQSSSSRSQVELATRSRSPEVSTMAPPPTMGGGAQGSTSAQKEGSPGQSDDKPPLNTAPVNKGKGKGKKGRGRRRW